MIKSINNISNISLMVPEGLNLTTSQKKVATSISKELNDMKLEKDRHFLIKPLEDDVVELSEVLKVKYKTNDTVDCKNDDLLYIGEYSEKQPFKSKDYLKAVARSWGDVLRLLALTVAGALALIAASPTSRSIAIDKNSTQQVEKVVTTIAKDSLKIIK